MNTDNNNTPTPSEIPPQSGQAISDSNQLKKFKVLFHLAQRSYGTAIVEAASPGEAWQKAKEIGLCDVNDWEVFEDDMFVQSVESFGEGQSHD